MTTLLKAYLFFCFFCRPGKKTPRGDSVNNYNNHTCIICGKSYHACPSCDRVRSFQPWRTITDSKDCYKIFLILNSCSHGYSDRTETLEQLGSCDLSQLDSFVPHIRETIQTILEREETIYVKEDH